MHTSQYSNQFTNEEKSIPAKVWRFVVHCFFIYVAISVFLFSINTANADMVFDFQKKMAEKGNAEAQFKVGEMYQTGRGVKQNSGAAVEWFTKAASNGHLQASHELLYLNIKKEGMSAENKSAAKDLSTKAKAGDGVSQYYLGLMYHHGVGLKKSNDKAMEWYKKAALKGVTSAEARIEEIKTAKSNWADADAKRKADAKKKAALAKKQKAAKAAEKAKKAKKAKKVKKAENNKVKKDDAQEARKKAQAEQAAKKAAEDQATERKRQALIKARQKRAKSKKSTAKKESSEAAEFEADPCSGKSARFLSTCR